MKREEAIKKLEHYRYCLDFQFGWFGEDDNEAIDMAIDALKADDEDEPQFYTEDDYWNGMFTESEEAYKAWTGEEMGGGRLIDADRLKSYIDCGHLRPPTEVCFSELDVCNMIDKAPTVLADRPQGEWKHTITWQPYCSNCEYVFGEDEEYSPFWKFCPMCGAEMADNSLFNDITESPNDVVEPKDDVIELPQYAEWKDAFDNLKVVKK